MSQQLLDIREYELTANVIYRIQMVGTNFQLMESPGDVSITFLRNGSALGFVMNVPAGFKWHTPSDQFFTEVQVLSAVNTTVKIHVGVTEAELARIVGEIDARPVVPDTIGDSGDLDIADQDAQEIPSLATRYRLHIQADEANSDYIRTGASDVLDEGRKLQPGAEVTYITSSAVWVKNESGNTQTYRYSWEALP